MMLKKILPTPIAATVGLSMFMEAVDTTIINTAIPAMSASLNVNPIDLKIALISYLVSLAIFIPISGWIGDKFGVKRVFTLSIAIFAVSSLWCGFAHNLTELIIARFLQGLGGSLALPLGRLIIIRAFERREVIIVMSQIAMIPALGLLLGPLLGGVITHYLSWHWIFWINVPVGVLGIYLARRYIPAYGAQHVPPIDKIGFVLFGSGLAGMTFGLSSLSESASNIHSPLIIIALSILCIVGYMAHSRTNKHPIVATDLFRFRSFKIAVLGNLCSRLGFGGIPFLVPLLLQIGLNYSSQLSGLLLAPTALGFVLVKQFSMRLLRSFGYRKLLAINTSLVGFAIWSFALVNATTHIIFIALLTFTFGLLTSLQYSGMNSLAYADIIPEKLSSATSIISTLQQLAQSFGVAFSAIFIRYLAHYLGIVNLLTIQILHETFFLMGSITVLSALIFLRLKNDDGHQMIA